MAIADIIKLRRSELGLTLKEIADKVGVSEATVQRYESGNIKNLRHDKIARLAQALEVSPAYLMGWTNDPQSDVDGTLEVDSKGAVVLHIDPPNDSPEEHIQKEAPPTSIDSREAMRIALIQRGILPANRDLTDEEFELLMGAAKGLLERFKD